MKKLLIGFILLLIAIGVGYLITKDSGYVLISYGTWSLETSLWVASVAFVVLFILFYFIVRLCKHTASIGSKFQNWGKSRQYEKAKRLTTDGLCQLAEGQWESAENTLVKAAQISDTPLIHYLSAARAAQAQNAFARRDNYLRDAIHHADDAKIAVGLTQAELQIAAKQWEQALATLKHLQELTPNHPTILKQLVTVYVELKDWQQLQALQPQLRKYQILTPDELDQLTISIYQHFIQQTASTKTQAEFIEFIKAIPKNLRLQPKIVAEYAKHLIAMKQTDSAAKLIDAALKKHWDRELAGLYGTAISDQLDKQISNAENWLKQHPHDAILLLSLARLCIAEKLWGKAKEYLEQSLQHRPSAETYCELGRVYEALGDKESAIIYYRQGAEIATVTL